MNENKPEQHLINPPPVLVEMLRSEAPYGIKDVCATRERHLVVAAYRAGADQQLNADCEWIDETCWGGTAAELRAAMRPMPKTPSLAEQALTNIDAILYSDPQMCTPKDVLEALQLSRRALERLQELENND